MKHSETVQLGCCIFLWFTAYRTHPYSYVKNSKFQKGNERIQAISITNAERLIQPKPPPPKLWTLNVLILQPKEATLPLDKLWTIGTNIFLCIFFHPYFKIFDHRKTSTTRKKQLFILILQLYVCKSRCWSYHWPWAWLARNRSLAASGTSSANSLPPGISLPWSSLTKTYNRCHATMITWVKKLKGTVNIEVRKNPAQSPRWNTTVQWCWLTLKIILILKQF